MRTVVIFIVLFSILSFNYGVYTPSEKKASSLKIQIDSESKLMIHGTTNINRFHCQYVEDFPDTVTLEVVPDQDHFMSFENATLSLDINEFDCGNNLINKDFRDLLEADSYPKLTIEVLGIYNTYDNATNSPSLSNKKDSINAHLKVLLAGAFKDYFIGVIRYKDSPELHTGSLEVDIRDFGLIPPTRMLGLMQVSELVNIDFYLKFRPIN